MLKHFGIVAALLLWSITAWAADAPLVLEAKIPLGNVVGRIDHLAIDLDRHRLFVAELGNDSVGVVDLSGGKLIRNLTGLNEPQGVGYVHSSDMLFVANAGNGVVNFFKGADLAPAGSLPLGDDADNTRVDANGRVYVGYGDGGIAILDADGRKTATIPLSAHPEAFQIDLQTERLYVNEPGAARIGVVDLKADKEIDKITFAGAGSVFPMAMDRAGHRIFVVYRSGFAKIAVFDTQHLRMVTEAGVCADGDDVFFDAKRDRLYVSCGNGALDVFSVEPDGLTKLATLITRPGTRTSLFVPELDRLFVAVRAEGGEPAQIWVYRPA